MFLLKDETISMILLKKGFLLTLILSFLVLEVFYGKLLVHINTVYFGDSGDALQSYYSALYHIRYDKTFFHTDGMNYPYGESIFFTGGHLPVLGLLRIINLIIPVSNYTIGILNMVMLLSIIACALSIYLIFKEFSLPPLYASAVAVGITFLSPQIMRLGGTLSYEFFIPLFLYLLIRFYRKPSFKISAIISLLTFFAITTHFYFFVFFCFLSMFYWAVLFFTGESNFNKIGFIAKHILIQTILPFLLLNTLLYITNHANDRTQYPWGFFEYTSSWAGVLFPFGKPYENLTHIIYNPTSSPQWEGITYIGVFGVVSFFILILVFLIKVLTKNFKQLFAVTDNKLLNIFFWASIGALLYSFGYPFIWKKELFLPYIGPLKEVRALGRFSWLFLYSMNIVAFYNIYQWTLKKDTIVKYCLLAIAIILLGYDVYTFENHHEDAINVSINELTDRQNNLSADNWLNDIKTSLYQAIIPLPYYHVGSENLWINSSSDLLKYVYIVSLKTGLPTTAVMLSRTSLSQTYKNISLVLEPYRNLEILKDMPSTKPFLVMAQPDKINEHEKYLLSKCKFLWQTPKYSVYELSYSTLQHYSDSLYAQTKEKLATTKTYLVDNYKSTDSIKDFIHLDFDDKPNAITYQGKGSYSGNIRKYNILYEGCVPNYKDSNYVFSFWMYNYTTDLYPRSVIEVQLKDSLDHSYKVDYPGTQNMLKTLDGKWALLEEEVKIRHASDKIKITLWNTDIWKNEQLLINQFWLKPVSCDIYQETSEYIFKNNRYYRQ